MIILQTTAATLDGLDIAMCVFDQDDRALLWNRAFLRYFPEHAEHVHVGEPYRDNLRRFFRLRLDPGEWGDIERFVEDGVARHHAQHRPYTFKHRGAWLQVASQPLPGVGRLRTWSRGARPRFSDAEETAASLAHGMALFEHVGDGIMLTDTENRITWVNEPFVDMFGLGDKSAAIDVPFEQVYRATWAGADAAQSSDFERGLSTLKENLQYAGAPFELALPGRRWTRVVEQRRDDGVGFFALVDITLLKRQQHELIDAERRARQSQQELAQGSRVLQATLEHMEQGVMLVNAQRIVEVCNRRAIELLDLPADLMASWPTFAQVLQHQWANDEFVNVPGDILAFIREGGLRDKAEHYDRLRPDGRCIEVQSVPIQGGGILRTYTDVTERKHAEATQRTLESQLRQAQKLEAIGTLAGGIAHDFNNIMAAILGNVAFARDAVGPGHVAQAYLEQINKAGRRARSLVQQILTFSQRQSSEFVTLALGPLVQETVTMLRSTMGPAVRLTCVLPDQALAVRGNATQLQQVLMNLGTNAWHALGGQGGHIEVGLEAVNLHPQPAGQPPAGLPAGHYVRLWVSDDGVGMDDATRERIFEPFFTTKPVGQGTGLGLAVAHGIVDAHGGAIDVQSVPGQGSTFHTYLPLVAHRLAPSAPESLQAVEMHGRGQHVLYIDDDEVMVLMVEGLLQRLGYRATCLADAQAAIALVRVDPHGVDLVVTDFNMPQCSGLDVVRALAAINPSLPVAISSGYISDELRESATALGVCAVMQKEHTLEALGPLVHAALSER